MATETAPRSEALPGYRLIEMIGRGGFGEVWRVEAPGGLQKACKFIHGRIVAGDDASGAKVHRELKGLERLKAVRHPFILSLERFDIVDGQLVVIMELADRDLEHRLREARDAGLPGIPRGELLRYMVESAEALDVMNVEYDIQHLDIKPSNIFLVRGHVKVADFGLSKGLDGRVGRISGGITPIYAAPETFDGWVSRHTDQYSLAILYQEMLTGTRPFPGPSPRQLMVQHMTAEPDLAALPECDRPIIKKALAKKPDDRHANCSQFAEALLAAEAGGIENLLQAARMSVSVPFGTPIVKPESKATPAKETIEATAGVSTVSIPKPSPTAWSPLPARPLPPASESSTTASFKRIQVTSALPKLPEFRRTTRKTDARPTLLVGLGRTGGRTVEALRKRVKVRLDAAAQEVIRWLWIDCDQTSAGVSSTMAIRKAEFADSLIRCTIPPHLRANDPPPAPPQRPHGATEIGTNGRRRLGRAALLANQAAVRQRLKLELGQFERIQAQGGGALPPIPRVVLVAAMAGGVGGGMLIDVAYWIKQLAKSLGLELLDIEVVLVAGADPDDPFFERRMVNQVALAREVARFSEPQASLVLETDAGPKEVHGPLARTIHVVDGAAFAPALPNAVAQSVAEFLVESSGAGLGRFMRQVEAEKRWPAFRSFGVAELIDSELKAARAVAARLGESTLIDWIGEPTDGDRLAIDRIVAERWREVGFSVGSTIFELKNAAAQRFGKAVEAAVTQAVHLSENALAQSADVDLKVWSMLAVQRVRTLLDAETDADKPNSWLTALGEARATVAKSVLAKLDDVASKAAVGQLARYSAIDYATAHLARLCGQLVTEAQTRRQAARIRLEAAVEGLQQALLRSATTVDRGASKSLFNMLKTKGPGTRQLPPAVAEFARDFMNKLREHAASFVEEHLEEAALVVCQEIAGELDFRVANARPRRVKLELLAATMGSSGSEIALPANYVLANRDADTLEQAVANALERVRSGGLGPFQQLLDATLESAGGIAELLARFDKEGPGALTGIVDTTEKYIVQRLGGGDAASRFLDRQAVDPKKQAGILQEFFAAANPSALDDSGSGIRRAAFLATPSDQTVAKFAALLGAAVGETPVPASGGNETLLVRIAAADSIETVLPAAIRASQSAFDAAKERAEAPELFPV